MSARNEDLINKDFVDFFKNTPHISNLLISCVDRIISIIGKKNLISIVLIGSASRSELSILESDSFEILGDIEFIIVVKNSIKKDKDLFLRSELNILSLRYVKPNNYFAIDYGIIKRSKLKYIPPTLWSSEFKIFGKTAYGEYLLNNIQSPSINNFDYGVLNELLISRLWNQLLSIPNVYLKNDLPKRDYGIINFSYARNSIDLLTILLPNIGILVFGYKGRNEFILNNINFIDNNISSLFNKMTNIKLNPNINDISDKNLMNEFIILLNYVLFIILKIENKDYQLINLKYNSLINLVKNKSIFKENSIRFIRRKIIDIRTFSKYYKYNLKFLKVIYTDFIKNYIFVLLVKMNIFIIYYKNKDIQNINKTISELKIISLIIFNKKFEENATPFEVFTLIRLEALELMSVWFYARSYFDKNKVLRFLEA